VKIVAKAAVGSGGASRVWVRYAWVAGILFVIALLAESVVSTGPGVSQDDSAAKIAQRCTTTASVGFWSATYQSSMLSCF